MARPVLYRIIDRPDGRFDVMATLAPDKTFTRKRLASLTEVNAALGLPLVAMALVLYGAGNGIYSIARGTVPLALFGPERYAPLLGRLARPGLVAQALAPPLGAYVLAQGGADATFALLAGMALLNVGLVGALWRTR